MVGGEGVGFGVGVDGVTVGFVEGIRGEFVLRGWNEGFWVWTVGIVGTVGIGCAVPTMVIICFSFPLCLRITHNARFFQITRNLHLGRLPQRPLDQFHHLPSSTTPSIINR